MLQASIGRPKREVNYDLWTVNIEAMIDLSPISSWQAHQAKTGDVNMTCISRPTSRECMHKVADGTRYNTGLLIKLTPKGVVFSFLFFSFLFFLF